MHSVVVVGGDWLAVQALEVDHCHSLVGLAVIIRAFPPGAALRVEKVALHVQVAYSAAVAHLGRNHIVVGLLHGLIGPLREFVHRHGAGRVAVRTVVYDVAFRNSEFLLQALVHGVYNALVSVAVHVGKAGYGLTVGEDYGSYVRAVKNAVGVAAQLVFGGCDIHLGGTGLQLATPGLCRRNKA